MYRWLLYKFLYRPLHQIALHNLPYLEERTFWPKAVCAIRFRTSLERGASSSVGPRIDYTKRPPKMICCNKIAYTSETVAVFLLTFRQLCQLRICLHLNK